MVDAAGDTKLVDYGIAAPVGEIAGVSGTPLYMAPEQWRGEPSNAATDVYAATATFVECLTGRPMFAGTTVGALLHQHLTIPPPLDDLPEAVRPIAAAGLAKDPAERIGDASALVAQTRRAGPGRLRAGLGAARSSPPRRARCCCWPCCSPTPSAWRARTRLPEPTSATARRTVRTPRAQGAHAAGPAEGVAAAEVALRRRRRPLTLVLGALVIAFTALALARHAGSTPASSNAAFEQRQPTLGVPAPSVAPTGADSHADAEPDPDSLPHPVADAGCGGLHLLADRDADSAGPDLDRAHDRGADQDSPTKGPDQGLPPSSAPPSSPPPGGDADRQAPPTSPPRPRSRRPSTNCPPTVAC